MPIGERESVWRSAESSNPGPSLNSEQIEGCVKAWAWRNTKGQKATSGVEKRDRDWQTQEAIATTDSEAPKLAVKFRAVKAILGERLALNELTNQIELDSEVVEDPGDLRLTLALDYGLAIFQSDCDVIIKRLAKENSYHPVKRYLEVCRQKYGDSTIVLEDLACRYFGCKEPIYQIFMKKTLVAAVARVYSPGCKVDTALILRSRQQGINKSTFFRDLAGPDWFDDSMGAATSEKDERLKLHQSWFLEWGELETVFSKKGSSAIKAFLSCQIDTVRPPYGRNAISLKRRSIIVGTTNQDEFLTDFTGNRRFWVIPVSKRIDLDLLAQERDRIWAAAVALYQAGYTWWLNQGEEAIAAELNEFYQTEDPWISTIRTYLRENSRGKITVSELLTHALQLEVGQQTKNHQMRVGDVLKALGWTRTERRVDYDGQRRRVWQEPDSISPSEDGSTAKDEVEQGSEVTAQPTSDPNLQNLTQSSLTCRDSLQPTPDRRFSDSAQLTQPINPILSSFFEDNGYHHEPLSDHELAELDGNGDS